MMSTNDVTLCTCNMYDVTWEMCAREKVISSTYRASSGERDVSSETTYRSVG